MSRYPPRAGLPPVALVGCLGGIGFTMSVFIATLALRSQGHLAAAKAGVLFASVTAAIIGLIVGRLSVRTAHASSGHVERSMRSRMRLRSSGTAMGFSALTFAPPVLPSGIQILENSAAATMRMS